MKEETNPYVIDKIRKETESERLQKIVEKLKIEYKDKSIKELMEMRYSLPCDSKEQDDIYYCLWDVIRDRFNSKSFQIENEGYLNGNPTYGISISKDKDHCYWLNTEECDGDLPYEIPVYLYEALLQFKSEYEDYINQY